MARPEQTYPQVEPGAAGLLNVGAVTVPSRTAVRRALDVARRRNAGLVVVGTRHVLRADLARAAALDMSELEAAALARPLPVVDVRTSEVEVRRRLGAGASLVVVRRGGRVVGGVERVATPRDADDAATVRLPIALPPAMAETLATVGEIAAARAARAFVVGGLVRDVLLGRAPARDIDVVIEGDGLAVARDLAARSGRRLVEHARFLTASVAGDGKPSDAVGRVDVATARLERYEARGALPRVRAAGIVDDLGRRDFSVNAMALELGAGGFRLLDPFGGRGDLVARRVRVLHPLSFVDDPTRMFRAARYAARLGFQIDAWSLRAQRLALSLVPYPRLSGQRIVAEIELIMSEPTSGGALTRLGANGVFHLLDPRFRFTRATARRVDDVAATLTWCERHGLDVRPVELALAALLADQTAAVTAAALQRLALAGEPLARITAAIALDSHAIAPARVGAESARAAALRDRTGLELAWLRLVGDAAVRDVLDWYVGAGRTVVAALRGEDVIALGVPRGPAVARTLGRLRDARLDGLVRSAEEERAYVRALLADGSEVPSSEGVHTRGEG